MGSATYLQNALTVWKARELAASAPKFPFLRYGNCFTRKNCCGWD